MPKIPQFRSIIKAITHAARFDGLDKNDQPVYNLDPLPILKAKGTVKLHGTNAAVCYNFNDGLWAQSKKNIITPLKDNAGFASFVEKNKDIFMDLMDEIYITHRIDLKSKTIAIYGEWAGQGIQAGVGISQLEKKFYIFGIKISSCEDIASYWIDCNILQTNNYTDIYNINDFDSFEIEIDFNEPLLSNNKMVEMVAGVEKECPVAKHFGVSGIGEGIVFKFEYKGNLYRFKMKGDKHAGKAKVKKSQKIGTAKLKKIIDVVEKVTPEWRLSQIYDEVFDIINGGKGDIKKTGDYLRAVIQDILAEDLDIILDANLTPKEVNQEISRKARTWFMIKLDEDVGIL